MRSSSFLRRTVLLGCAVAGLASGSASACTVCSVGEIAYFEWKCVNQQWTTVQVGLGVYPECGGTPTLVWGKKTTCFGIDRDVGGGTADTGQCSSWSCPPAPTTACPPPPPPPPVFPPVWDPNNPGERAEADPVERLDRIVGWGVLRSSADEIGWSLPVEG